MTRDGVPARGPTLPPAMIDDRPLGLRIRAALAANLRALLVIPAVAVAVALGYYQVPAVHDALAAVGRLKAEWGLLFSALSTGLFAGLLPVLVRIAAGRIPAGLRRRELAVLVPLLTWRGIEVDLLYRLQGLLFDGLPGIWCVVVKTLVDQTTFTALWATPTGILIWRWKDHGWAALAGGAWKRGLAGDWISTLVANWLVWIPALCAIYAMPADLQIPLFSLVACLWMLIMSSNLEKPAAQASGA